MAADGETFVEGLVYPPPAIREIVDKTAAHIGKQGANGPMLEDKIRQRGAARFSFINAEDPFHGYYQHRLDLIKSGKADADGSGTPLAAAGGAEEPKKKPAVPDDGRPKVPQPAPFDFLLDLPTMSPADYDVLKLTALFVARNGRKFQGELATREKANYQFDFLQPSHSLFSVFNKLVQHYSQILIVEQKRIEALKAQAGLARGSDVSERERRRLGRKALKGEVGDRVAWTAWEAAQRQKEADEEEARRIAFAEIDWQDFVVVNTVELTQEDEEAELDAPKSLSDIVNMSMRDKHTEAMVMEGKTLPTDQDEEQVMAAAARKAQGQEDQDSDAEMDMEDESEPQQQQQQQQQQHDQIKTANNQPAQGDVKIRPQGYVPKSKRNKNAGLTKCTICGEMIPVDDITEHVRIELLDPRWKEKQQVAEHNRAASNLLGTGADVAASLRKMAHQRSDIFSEAGMTENEKRQRAEEELRRKAKEREAIVWDGHIASAELSTQRFQTTANLDSQINALHRAKGLTEEESQGPKIGPGAPVAPGSSSSAAAPAQPGPSSSSFSAADPFPQPASGSTISAAPQANMLNPNAPQMYNPYGIPLMQPGQTSLPPGYAPAPAPAPAPDTGSSGTARPADAAPEGEPDAKRARTATADQPQFYDEQSWIDTHPEPITITVQMPESAERPEWNVKGQTITLADVPLTALVSTLRERVHAQTQVPPGKQQLKWNDRLLSNRNTLASYNFDSGQQLSLTIKKK